MDSIAQRERLAGSVGPGKASMLVRYGRSCVFVFLAVLVCLGLLGTWSGPAAPVDGRGNPGNGMVAEEESGEEYGIRFSCRSDLLVLIEAGMAAYMASLDIPPAWVKKRIDRHAGKLLYTLNTSKGDFDTLTLKNRAELQIRDAVVRLPGPLGQERRVETVSQKEILLALLQQGRLTEFAGAACDIEALREQVGIRQNTVAWAETLEWVWPDGEPARWNGQYWSRGTPRQTAILREAFNDLFFHQEDYSIGCYTATKMVMVQGVLDYYGRVKRDPLRLALVQTRLSLDQEPLQDVEPGKMWDFEGDFDAREWWRPGKLLKIAYGAKPKNFVPGDWVYFLNTDQASYEKTGYEGSNAIYLGRNRFSDYYNDNDHAYSYQEKLDEVYQWRNGVFSRRRDGEKMKPLFPEDFERLGRSPAEGGLLKDFRVSHYFFGYEPLPVVAVGGE